MAYGTALTAIYWRAGEYQFGDKVNIPLDLGKLSKDGILRDVTDSSSGYADHIGVLGRQELARYAKSQEDQAAIEAIIEALPDAAFFFVHQYEWESGFGD